MPSIRVTPEAYEGLKSLVEASYEKTISGVIERFLKEEGIIPLKNNVNQASKQNEANEVKEENPIHLEEKNIMDERDRFYFEELRTCLKQYRFQRDAMRDLYKKYNGDRNKIVSAYAWLEEKGYAPRKNNTHNFTSTQYSEALYNDGLKKGWLPAQ